MKVIRKMALLIVLSALNMKVFWDDDLILYAVAFLIGTSVMDMFRKDNQN